MKNMRRGNIDVVAGLAIGIIVSMVIASVIYLINESQTNPPTVNYKVVSKYVEEGRDYLILNKYDAWNRLTNLKVYLKVTPELYDKLNIGDIYCGW